MTYILIAASAALVLLALRNFLKALGPTMEPNPIPPLFKDTTHIPTSHPTVCYPNTASSVCELPVECPTYQVFQKEIS
jgi:hypothetical protein